MRRGKGLAAAPTADAVQCHAAHAQLTGVAPMSAQAVLHYGEAIKAVMNEELGDGCAAAVAVKQSVMRKPCSVVPPCYSAAQYGAIVALHGPVCSSDRQNGHRIRLCTSCGLHKRLLTIPQCFHSIMSAIDMYASLAIIEGKQGEKRVVISLNGCDFL